MTTQAEANDASAKTWQFERKVSLPVMITILGMLLAGAAAFWKVQAQATENATSIEKLETVPADIIRIQEQLAQLRTQQAEIKDDLSNSSSESREADAMQLQALQNVLIAITRLEEKLNNQ